MKAVLGIGMIGLAAAAWGGEPGTAPGPQPEIPRALHGCWELHELGDDEFQPFSAILVVTADGVTTQSTGVGRRTGTVELVERLTPTLIEGRITAIEEGRPITLATTLEVGAEGAGPGELLLREGDAGSYVFQRCSPATQAAQRFSLVIAETSRQDDPVPAPCGPDRTCGDSLFRAVFRGARVIAGGVLPADFEARLKLHTPLIGPTTLAMIVERQADGALLVQRRAGFNGRNGIACFDAPDEHPVDWTPDVPAVRSEKGTLCLSDPTQIDPAAPKD